MYLEVPNHFQKSVYLLLLKSMAMQFLMMEWNKKVMSNLQKDVKVIVCPHFLKYLQF